MVKKIEVRKCDGLKLWTKRTSKTLEIEKSQNYGRGEDLCSRGIFGSTSHLTPEIPATGGIVSNSSPSTP